MKKEEIIQKVKSLKLSKGSYVVFGSGPMAAAGIRETNDIDLLVSPETYETLEKRGWKKANKGPGDTPLVKGDFEAHDSWKFSSYSPTLEQLLSTATIVESVPFASMHEVRKWKDASDRTKDIADIKLIDKYLEGLN